MNQDGLLDIFVSNIAAQYALEESHFMFTSTGNLGKMKDGLAPYVDSSESLGVSRSNWSWDTRFGDFDNDGSVEALQATGFLKGSINRWPELQEVATGNDALLSNSNVWFSVTRGDDLSGNAVNPFYAKGKDNKFHDISGCLLYTSPSPRDS